MPELPEVETIRRDLQRALKEKQIEKVQVRKEKMVRGSARSFLRRLKGKKVEGVRRRGKLLIFNLSEGCYLLIHLKMTGQLIYVSGKKTVAGGHSQKAMETESLPNNYSHIIFHFTDGSHLYFNDMRQFGFTALVNDVSRKQIEAQYGVEPLSSAFSVNKLSEILNGRKSSLKSTLLNQKLIAGLGNIYVDEACFYAGVLPSRMAGTLTDTEIKKLHRGIKYVLKQALIYRGTTFNNYRDAQGKSGDYVRRLKVYGRAGRMCTRCRNNVIKRSKVGQRGTAYCPACQI